MSELPSVVLWIGGIAALLGFVLGSINPRSEYAASEFDLPGALVWALAAGGIAGGAALFFTAGAYIGLAAVGLGIVMAAMRLNATRPYAVPKGADLAEGVTRVEGSNFKQKFRAAEKLYGNASFRQGSYYATRAPNDWRFGSDGMSKQVLDTLSESLKNCRPNRFDILVLLVRSLPGTADEPGVIVVRGGEKLRKVTIENGDLVIPDVGAVPARVIAASVSYAWR